MRILFAGTPEFAARCLAALLESRHELCGVMTQPDRPAGRGLAAAARPVKKLAAGRGIPVLQPPTLKDEAAREQIRALRPEAIVTAAFGLLLPQQVLDMAPRRALNVHASLLPRWRGAAPIQRALLAGDEVTGVSIMLMEAGLDTGPVLLRESVPISRDDTTGTLTERLAELGGRLVVRALNALEADGLEAVPQPAEGVTYAPKLGKDESRIDWREDAAQVNRRVRAFNPAPGAVARVRGVDLKIFGCDLVSEKGEPGEVLRADRSGLRIGCGTGAVDITELQRPGGRRLKTADFLRGFAVSPGDRFES